MKKLYMILPLALILCLMVGCQDKEAMAELEEFKAQAAVEEQNKALVSRLLKEVDENIDIMDEVFAEDFIAYYATSTVHGLEDFKKGTKAYHSSFTEMVHIIDDLIADGDKVGARVTLRAKHTGDFMGIPSTGKQVEYKAIIWYRIADGKIQEAWTDYDSLFGLMQQFGFELKPKEGEK